MGKKGKKGGKSQPQQEEPKKAAPKEEAAHQPEGGDGKSKKNKNNQPGPGPSSQPESLSTQKQPDVSTKTAPQEKVGKQPEGGDGKSKKGKNKSQPGPGPSSQPEASGTQKPPVQTPVQKPTQQQPPQGKPQQQGGQGRGWGPPAQQQLPPGFSQQQQPPQGLPQQQQPPQGYPQPQQGGQQQKRGTQGPPAQKSPPQQQAQQRPPSQMQSAASLPEKVQGMAISPRMPQRKNIGKEGRPIQVETNHFLLTISNYKTTVYHYDVDIQPEKPYRLYRKIFLEFQRRNFPNHPLAYDLRKSMFTVSELKGRLCDAITIKDDERSPDQPGLDFTVTISCVNRFSWQRIQDYFKTGQSTSPPQIEIQALDIVLRQAAYSCQQFVSVGRSFFSAPDGEAVPLGNGLVLWRGFYQSAILGWKPYLNVDVAHKGFPEPVACTEALKNICGADLNNEIQFYQLKNFEQYMKGLKIVYEIPRQRNSRRVYKVTKLDESPARKSFDMDGKQITVQAYFATTKNYTLRYPKLPCLQVGTKGTCLPLELCTIVEGQSVMRKLDERQTAAMVKAAARPPHERREHIMRSVGKVAYNNNSCIRNFGITVSDQFAKVNARILVPPSLNYAEVKVPVRNGVWEPSKFSIGGQSRAWAVLDIAGSRSGSKLASELQKTARNLGVDLSSAAELCEVQTRRGDRELPNKLQRKFSELKQKSIDFVVVIIPNDNYGQVKFSAELSVGILTQCIKSRTVDRLNFSVVKNILLKINAKLNGSNHSIWKDCSVHFKLMQRPVMICGADVTHPSPGQECPSVAAVTASFDVRAFKYNVEWRIQNARDEVIRDLKQIMINHLQNFYKIAKCKPERILFYRDGVSEGQFTTILREELPAIRAACKALQADGYEPKITLLVVQKRHHTRFFPGPRDADGKNRNVPAGTIVDSEITHPLERDFYLVSHASIQGTSRPTKYHVLWDDADMGEDELQVTTYFLCHMFTRCCRSVSYPAPTYYAHLAAFRIRAYAECTPLEKLNTTRSYLQIQEALKLVNPMFYV